MNCPVLGCFRRNVPNGRERELTRTRVLWQISASELAWTDDRQTDGQQTDEQRIERGPYTIGLTAIICGGESSQRLVQVSTDYRE